MTLKNSSDGLGTVNSMNENYKRHHERIHRKYVKLRPTIKDCNCGGFVGMNEIMGLRLKFKWFYIECEDCHWCSRSMPTIRTAIRAWNKDMEKQNSEALKRAYGGSD